MGRLPRGREWLPAGGDEKTRALGTMALMLARWPVTCPPPATSTRSRRSPAWSRSSPDCCGLEWRLEPREIQGSIPGMTLFPRTGTGRARSWPGSPSWPETLSGSPGLTSLPWTKAHCRGPPLTGLPPWLDRASRGHCPAASRGHCPASPSGEGRSPFCPQPSLLPNKRTRRALSGLQGLMGSAAKC